MSRDALRAGRLKRALGGVTVRVYPRLGSTSARAEELLERGRLRPPFAVVASVQTAGRGRGVNRWWSDGGSLCVTFALPARQGLPPAEVPLRAALAVVDAVAPHVPPGCLRVKWPNDVLAGGRKIAGIICGRMRGADVIGIGLNVSTGLRKAPRDVAKRATSIAAQGGRAPARAEALASLWHALREAMAAEDWRTRYAGLHVLDGARVRVARGDGETGGVCRGVDAQGRLLVSSGGAIRALTEGTVVEWGN